MLNLGKAAEGLHNTGGAKMPAQINLNVQITDIVVEDNYIEFALKDTQGRSYDDRIWIPEADRYQGRNGKSAEEVYNEEVNNRLDRIAQYAKVFLLPEDLVTIQAPTLLEIAKKAHQVLKPKLSTKTVNVKLVKTKDKMYTDSPRYAPYVEVHEEGKPSGLKYSKYELENLMGETEGQSDVASDKPKFNLF